MTVWKLVLRELVKTSRPSIPGLYELENIGKFYNWIYFNGPDSLDGSECKLRLFIQDLENYEDSLKRYLSYPNSYISQRKKDLLKGFDECFWFDLDKLAKTFLNYVDPWHRASASETGLNKVTFKSLLRCTKDIIEKDTTQKKEIKKSVQSLKNML